MPDSSSDRNVVEVLAEEFVERYRTGERPPLREYTERFPEHAEEIADLFPALLMMENLKPAEENEDDKAAEPALKQIGDYRILGEVGRGGMGIVYEAEQLSLGRRVAVKVLPQQMLLDEKHKRRFEREAKAAARLHHTNIVPVFGVGEQEGMHYYVMQFIQGLGLDEVLEELRHMKVNSQAGITATQRDPSGGRRSDAFSAARVARSLVSGQFEQTILTNDKDESLKPARLGSTIGFDPNGADAGLEVHQSGAGVLETAMESAGLGDTSSGRMSDSQSGSPSLSLSGSLSLSARSESSISTSAARARRKQTFFTSVANMGRQVASALQYAHEQGVTHRDIKPSNLLLDMQGTVWVTDFGLAKANDQQDITHTGDILGTLRYMPPEAFEGGTDARGDQYSLGLTLYELLAQKPAFDEKDRHTLIKLVTTSEPTRIEKLNRDVPRDLATIVHKAIDRDPAHRYASAGELAADLERFLEDEPIKARRPSVAERLGRWSRRNRGLAASLSVISALVLILAIGSTVAAGHFRAVAREKEELASDNQRLAEEQTEYANNMRSLADEKETQRRIADEARAEALAQRDRAEGSLYTTRLALAENHLNSGDGVNAQRSLAAAIPGGNETDRRGWEWNYLNHWSDSAERTLGGHSTSNVYAVAFSPDGRLLASAGGGNPYFENPGAEIVPGEVLIRDFATGRVLHTLDGHRNIVNCLAFSPDGNVLATAGRDLRIIIWNVATGEQVIEVDCPADDRMAFTVQFSPNGESVLAAFFSGVCRIYSVADGEEIHSFAAMTAVYNHDGSQIYFMNLESSQAIQSLNLDSLAVQDFIETHGIDWGNCQLTSSTGGRYLGAVNHFLLTRPGPAELFLWELETGELLQRLPNDDRTAMLTFSADEEFVAVSGESPAVRVFEVATGNKTATLLGHETTVTGASFSPGGRWLASASMDGTVRVFPSRHDSRGIRIEVRQAQTSALAFADNNAAIRQVGWDYDQVISTWDANNGALLEEVSAELNDDQVWPRSDYAFSPDARRLAATRKGDHCTVTIWDAVTGKELLSLGKHPGPVSAVAFSGDGHRLATASLNLTGAEIRIWDATTGELMRTTPVGFVTVTAIAFSPDGSSVATGGVPAGYGPCVSIWDLETGNAMFHFSGPGFVYGLAFSPDGTRLAAADYGSSQVQVWDTERGEQIGTIDGIRAASHVAWSPDGTRLAAIGYDANVHLIHPETLEELIVLRTLGPPTGTLGFTPRVAFSPDGSKIAGNSPHGIVTVWDAGSSFSNFELESLVMRMMTHLGNGKYERAGEAARRALALKIDNDDARQMQMLASMTLAICHLVENDGLNDAEIEERLMALMEGTPNGTETMLATARFLADFWTSRNLWTEAAHAHAMIAELAPEQTDASLRAAPVAILAGDRAAYELQCRRVLEQFHDSDSMRDVRVMLKVCLLLPDVVPVEDLPAARVEEQLSVGEPDRATLPWEYTTLALVAWRSGDAEGALRWSQLSLDEPNARPAAQALGLVLRAMAQHELGETDAASDSLTEAGRLIDPALEEFQPETLPTGWQDWLIADVLRQEAVRVMEGESNEPAGGPSEHP